MGDVIESLASLVKSGVGLRRANQREKDAREDYAGRFQAGKWDPELVSDSAPDFQKANSPVARAYLESFLTGSNPDAIQGTRLGADAQRAAAQQNFNRDYGGWDRLVREQAAENADNSRFEIAPMDSDVDSAARFYAGQRAKHSRM